LLSQLKVILLLLLLSFPIFSTNSAPIWARWWEFRALATLGFGAIGSYSQNC
jgi:hypothetical protein